MPESDHFKIEVLVNDRPIAMNSFVQDIVSNVIYALVQSLKIPDQADKIEITLTRS